MNQRLGKWLKFALRWSIAIGGMAWVISSMSFRDRVLYLDAMNRPVEARVLEEQEQGRSFVVIDPDSGAYRTVQASRLVSPPDAETVRVRQPDGSVAECPLLGLDLGKSLKRVHRFLIAPADEERGVWVEPGRVVDYQLRVPRPLVQTGVYSMVRDARLPFLLGAVFVFPVTFLLTAFRWHELLKALEIRIGQSKAFIITMVGAFYNTFMPGSTGGDLLKAIYVAKFTEHRTRAVVSVLVDRVIGLLALVLLGGITATYYSAAYWGVDPAVRSTLKVALACAGILLGTITAVGLLYVPVLRRWTGLGWVLDHLPMQAHVQKTLETMVILARRPWLIVLTIVVTLPVHMTVVLSAMFAGMAFGLPLSPMYYWVVVPVIVLVAAIPISPQGAGVMEAFAIALTRTAGASVSEAVALTMSIRTVQVLWNLTGGFWVLRGGYHAPTEQEQAALEAEGAPVLQT